MCNESVEVPNAIWNASMGPAKLKGWGKSLLGVKSIQPVAKQALLLIKTIHLQKIRGNWTGSLKNFKTPQSCLLEPVIKSLEIAN